VEHDQGGNSFEFVDCEPPILLWPDDIDALVEFKKEMKRKMDGPEYEVQWT